MFSLKLPYRLSEDPFEAARKFTENNKLPDTYVDQVVNFITTNLRRTGRNGGDAPPGLGSNIWGTKTQYRPSEVGAPSEKRPSTLSKILPQTEYVMIFEPDPMAIRTKILDFNQHVADGEFKLLSLSAKDQDILARLAHQLSEAQLSTNASTEISCMDYVQLIYKVSIQWPTDKRLPGLGLLRLLAATPSSALVGQTSKDDSTIVDLLASSELLEPSLPPSGISMVVNVLSNLFSSDEGRFILDGSFSSLRKTIAPFLEYNVLRQHDDLALAVSTLYLNYAVLLPATALSQDRSGDPAHRALGMLEDLTNMLPGCSKNHEALYRCFVAIGTVLTRGMNEAREAVRRTFSEEPVVGIIQKGREDSRIKNLQAEIRELLS